MPWSTRYSPSRLPDWAHSSSAVVNWSWESSPAFIRTSPSLRRRLGDPGSSGFRSELPMPVCPHPHHVRGYYNWVGVYLKRGTASPFYPGSVLAPRVKVPSLLGVSETEQEVTWLPQARANRRRHHRRHHRPCLYLCEHPR